MQKLIRLQLIFFSINLGQRQDTAQIVKVVQNQLLFRKTIDAVRQLILQDRHVTCREIKTTLGISGSFFCQKNLFALDPTQFVNRSIKGSCRLVERNATKKIIAVLLSTSITIVTGNESWIYV